MEQITIIGTGLAGYTLAKEFRKLNKEAPLRLITADDGAFYSKPMLSNALAAGKSADSLVITPADKMSAQLNADILTHCTVSSINAQNKQIYTSQGVFHYGQLVLALGADAFTPPMQGNASHAVLQVNNLADYARWRDAIQQAKTIALLGAGLIGCEFANDLAQAGYRVQVIDLADTPLGRLLPAPASTFLQQRLESLGISFHLGTSVAQINAADNGYQIQLQNGKIIQADAILSAVGLRPKVLLAQQLGLQVNRGIVCNRHLQTSQASIYALGDCVEVEGLVLPYVLPLMQQARALAATLAGTPTVVKYPAMPVSVKTPACPTIVAPPAQGAIGEWQIEVGPEGVTALFNDPHGHLLGYALLGDAYAQRQSYQARLPVILA